MTITNRLEDMSFPELESLYQYRITCRNTDFRLIAAYGAVTVASGVTAFMTQNPSWALEASLSLSGTFFSGLYWVRNTWALIYLKNERADRLRRMTF